jgi:hypothetical protein
MKNILITSITVLAFFTIAIVTGCKDKPCDVITCAHSGTCVDGLCACPVGYEGLHCETIMRDKFVGEDGIVGGIWNVNEDGSLSPKTQYSTIIKPGTFINQVLLYNVQNVEPFKSTPVTATILHDTITIPLQTASDGSKIVGWGFIKSTNVLDQHYYQHATVTFYYDITNKLGQVNKYGLTDGIPSIWSK